MKKLKKISIVFLLIVLTCCIIFMPQAISGQSEEDLLNKIVYRNYNVGSRPKLTSEQVARLYYNGEIFVSYNSLPVSGPNGDSEILKKNVMELIEMLFGKDKAVCDLIKNTLSVDNAGENISYSRNSSLIKVNNQPIAFYFVQFSVKNSYFEILYEEKTQTVISFSCETPEQKFKNWEDTYLFLEKMVSMIHDYYKEQLNFNENEYFVSIAPAILASEEIEYSTNIYINFGLMQRKMSEYDNNKYDDSNM